MLSFFSQALAIFWLFQHNQKKIVLPKEFINSLLFKSICLGTGNWSLPQEPFSLSEEACLHCWEHFGVFLLFLSLICVLYWEVFCHCQLYFLEKWLCLNNNHSPLLLPQLRDWVPNCYSFIKRMKNDCTIFSYDKIYGENCRCYSKHYSKLQPAHNWAVLCCQ